MNILKCVGCGKPTRLAKSTKILPKPDFSCDFGPAVFLRIIWIIIKIVIHLEDCFLAIMFVFVYFLNNFNRPVMSKNVLMYKY